MKKKVARENAKLIERLAYMQGFNGHPMNGIVLIAHTAAHSESDSVYPLDSFYFSYQRGRLDKEMCVKRGYIEERL